jgi:hypothetical protein
LLSPKVGKEWTGNGKYCLMKDKIILSYLIDPCHRNNTSTFCENNIEMFIRSNETYHCPFLFDYSHIYGTCIYIICKPTLIIIIT